MLLIIDYVTYLQGSIILKGFYFTWKIAFKFNNNIIVTPAINTSFYLFYFIT